jgi:hypothetical protein
MPEQIGVTVDPLSEAPRGGQRGARVVTPATASADVCTVLDVHTGGPDERPPARELTALAVGLMRLSFHLRADRLRRFQRRKEI